MRERRVSGGVQDAGSHVVHYTEQHAAKIDADVGHGIPQHLGGSIHGHQQGPAAGDAAHSEQQAHDHGDGQRGVHGSWASRWSLAPRNCDTTTPAPTARPWLKPMSR